MTSTTKIKEPEIILKTDCLGRVRMPPEPRELILDRFAASGQSGQSFAAHIGVKYPTFATWVQKRRRARGAYTNEACLPIKAPLTLVEAVVESESSELSSPALEVTTESGLNVRLMQSEQVPLAIDFLKALKDAQL